VVSSFHDHFWPLERDPYTQNLLRLHMFMGVRGVRGVREGISLTRLIRWSPHLSSSSALIASGAHLSVIQELLGHSSYSITADIYSHVAVEQQREAAERLGEAFPRQAVLLRPLVQQRPWASLPI
jgi:integrase